MTLTMMYSCKVFPYCDWSGYNIFSLIRSGEQSIIKSPLAGKSSARKDSALKYVFFLMFSLMASS